MNLTDSKFNNETICDSEDKYALIDTDQPTIWVPKADFANIAEKLSGIENITCNETYCLSTQNNCTILCLNQTYPLPKDVVWNPSKHIGNLSFTIDDTIFNLPCTAFTESNTTNQTDVQCNIKIDGSHDEYRFGIPFLESFIVSYNYEHHDVIAGDPDYNATYLRLGVNRYAP